jgi:hypothetical protein
VRPRAGGDRITFASIEDKISSSTSIHTLWPVDAEPPTLSAHSYDSFFHSGFSSEASRVPSLGLGMVVHICNPSIQEVEVGRRKVPGQPGLLVETLSQKPKTKQTKRVLSLEPQPLTWASGGI